MLNTTRHHAGRPSSGSSRQTPQVCVVDLQPSDYDDWQQAARANCVELRFVPNASEALRLSHTGSVDLWVVNADLPGLSGTDLCSMIKGRSPEAAVFVVADEYTPAKEQAALQARATLFGVKPSHHAWFASWAERHATQPTGSRETRRNV